METSTGEVTRPLQDWSVGNRDNTKSQAFILNLRQVASLRPVTRRPRSRWTGGSYGSRKKVSLSRRCGLL